MRITSIRRTFGRAALAAVLLLGSSLGTATAAFTTTELAGIGPAGQAPDLATNVQDISADGSVVFLSGSVVFAGIGPNWTRVYLRSGNATTAITPSVGFPVERAGISDSGRFVVYTLGSGVAPSVHLYDTTDQTTVDVITIGSSYPEFVQNSRLDVSDDGRFVQFDTVTSLDVADINGVRDVYRYDRQLASLDWVSRNPDGTPSDGASTQPHMTPDGSTVVFTSVATNLVADDTNAVRDAFRWVAPAVPGDPPSLTRVSTDASGTQLTAGVGVQTDVTDDGRSVVFDTIDALVAPVAGWSAVIMKDTATGTVEAVSHSATKRDDVNARSATVSGDGSVVAYESDWPWINFRAQGAHYDVVVKDRAADAIELMDSSTPNLLTEGNGQANDAHVSADGTFVAFDSQATNLVASPAIPSFTSQVYRVTRSARHPQAVTFANPGAKTLAQSPFTPIATTSSGLPVIFTSLTPAVCTTDAPGGVPIELVATGSCRVTASQPGSPGFSAATSVTRAFNVNKANQSITFANPGAKTMLQGQVALVGTATSGLTVTFASSTPLICVASGTTVTLVSAGSCSITASQPGSSVYNPANPITRAFNVNKVNQTTTFAALANQPITSATVTVGATATSGLDVSFTTTTPLVCTSGGTNGSTITLVTAGTCTVRADQAGDIVYKPANAVNRSFTITKLAQTITFASPGAKTLAQSPVTVTGTASSGLGVTFTTTTPLVCTAGGTNGSTIALLTVGTCTVRADQVGDTVYKAANAVSRNFAVR